MAVFGETYTGTWWERFWNRVAFVAVVYKENSAVLLDMLMEVRGRVARYIEAVRRWAVVGAGG